MQVPYIYQIITSRYTYIGFYFDFLPLTYYGFSKLLASFRPSIRIRGYSSCHPIYKMYLYTGIRFTTLLCLSKYMYQIYNIALLWLLLNIHLYYLQRLFPHSMYKTFYFCRQKWNQCVHTPNAQVPVLHTSIYRGIEYTQLLKASGLC